MCSQNGFAAARIVDELDVAGLQQRGDGVEVLRSGEQDLGHTVTLLCVATRDKGAPSETQQKGL
jgi:hypothetical protein